MTAPRLAGISLDCADPVVLADFYRTLLDGETLWSAPDSAGVRASGVVLVAQRVEDYAPPVWPDTSIVHLDLAAVPDLDSAVARAIGLGATTAGFQPDPRWRVLLDPAGHPFCLTTITPDA